MTKIRRIRIAFVMVVLVLADPLSALGQSKNEQPAAAAQAPQQIPALDEITISPSRIELIMEPGTEKTFVINLIYSLVTGKAKPARVLSYLGDWAIAREGKVYFQKAGSMPNSASPWIVFTPAEATIEPGKTHSIRVTVSVPKEVTPGDHLSVLFVEPRPDNIKLEKNRKQVITKFRLASVFYVMVPGLTRKGSLESLRAQADERGILITPLLKNTGNSHIRPTYSVKVMDRHGAVVAEAPQMDSLPVLAGSETEVPVIIDKVLPEGNYMVQYRVAFEDGGEVTEGRTEILVKGQVAQPPAALTQNQKSQKKEKQ